MSCTAHLVPKGYPGATGHRTHDVWYAQGAPGPVHYWFGASSGPPPFLLPRGSTPTTASCTPAGDGAARRGVTAAGAGCRHGGRAFQAYCPAAGSHRHREAGQHAQLCQGVLGPRIVPERQVVRHSSSCYLAFEQQLLRPALHAPTHRGRVPQRIPTVTHVRRITRSRAWGGSHSAVTLGSEQPSNRDFFGLPRPLYPLCHLRARRS